MAHKELESLILHYLARGRVSVAGLAYDLGEDALTPACEVSIRHALVRLEMRREVTVTDTPAGVVWSL